MRLLADENFPLASVQILREAGHDVLAVSESSSGASDTALMRRAAVEGRVILTFDRVNREFRRRTKTQASFASEAAAVTLLFGLVACGQITLRRIDGYQHLPRVLTEAVAA